MYFLIGELRYEILYVVKHEYPLSIGFVVRVHFIVFTTLCHTPQDTIKVSFCWIILVILE